MSTTDARDAGVEPLPVLHHDGSRLDWLTAQYKATVALKQQVSTVVHELTDGPEIEALLKDGSAAYATEVRCPRTMLSRIVLSASHDQVDQVIEFKDTERNDDLFLIPGIIAKSNATLPTDGLHPLVRGGRPEVQIPAGWWLARGGEYRFTPLLVNLLRFVKDKDDKLRPGTMSVEEAILSGDPYFRVTLAAELYDHRREDRDVQIAALIAAFGHLPRSSMATGQDNEDCPLAETLRSRFESASPPVPDWDDPEFDPARAATSIENFWLNERDDE